MNVWTCRVHDFIWKLNDTSIDIDRWNDDAINKKTDS